MNETLLGYYEQELRYLREMGGEFATAFPKVAARLGLDAFECADPYVERLLEGFSFLSARVRMELDAQFPAFTQHLAEMVYPGLLAPTPSMAVVQFQPDATHPALANGATVPRGTALVSRLGPDGTTRCEFRTAHAVTMWPLRLAQVRYRAFDRLPRGLDCEIVRTPKAMLTFKFDWHPGAQAATHSLDRLPLYLRGTEGLAERLYMQMTGRVCGAYLCAGEGQRTRYAPLPARCVNALGFEDAQALLPASGATFRGCRLLREYFAFAPRFSFVELTGMEAAACRESASFDIALLLDTFDETLQSSVDESNFALHCTPAINLFARRADRIAIDDRRFEHQVIVDRTRPLDFEVFSVEGIEGHVAGRTCTRRFAPFYRAGDPRMVEDGPGYFQTRRAPRVLSAAERAYGPRSHYAGTEVFVVLVDPAEAPYPEGLQQLGVDVLCTNRHLPLAMPVGAGSSDFTCGADLPAIERIRCLSGPSAPRPPLSDRAGQWRLIEMLSASRLPLFECIEAAAGARSSACDAHALRRWLSALCPLADEAALQQIAQLSEASARAVTRRLPLPGPACFGRGLEIVLTFDDAAWSGARASVFAAVLAAALADYMPINQFAQTLVRTPAQGVVMRYPARAGQCEIL